MTIEALERLEAAPATDLDAAVRVYDATKAEYAQLRALLEAAEPRPWIQLLEWSRTVGSKAPSTGP